MAYFVVASLGCPSHLEEPEEAEVNQTEDITATSESRVQVHNVGVVRPEDALSDVTLVDELVAHVSVVVFDAPVWRFDYGQNHDVEHYDGDLDLRQELFVDQIVLARALIVRLDFELVLQRVVKSLLQVQLEHAQITILH